MHKVIDEYFKTFLVAVRHYDGADLARLVAQISEDMENDQRVEENIEALIEEIETLIAPTTTIVVETSDKHAAVLSQMHHSLSRVRSHLEAKREDEAQRASQDLLAQNPLFGLF